MKMGIMLNDITDVDTELIETVLPDCKISGQEKDSMDDSTSISVITEPWTNGERGQWLIVVETTEYCDLSDVIIENFLFFRKYSHLAQQMTRIQLNGVSQSIFDHVWHYFTTNQLNVPDRSSAHQVYRLADEVRHLISN